MKPLDGQVALVAGATRGAGRGIAAQLGAAGATVICTGRSTVGNRSDLNRPETIDQTAELVTAAGGRGVAIACDHMDEGHVQALMARVHTEFGGLDILVNDIWGGESLSEWGKRVWEQDLAKGRLMLERAIWTHIVTAKHALPLLLARERALIAEITDGDGLYYRGNFFYDLAKTGVMRLAVAWAGETEGSGLTSLSLTPGFLRSEEMLDHFGVTEATWQEAVKQDPNFAESETPHFVGRALAALAADPERGRWNGQALASWTLMDAYGFTDIDGRRPHWGRWFERVVKPEIGQNPQSI